MIKKEWNAGPVFHNFWMGWSAPDMTAVSKPNKNPAMAAVTVQSIRGFFVMIF
jgi:hypothetical protein